MANTKHIKPNEIQELVTRLNAKAQFLHKLPPRKRKRWTEEGLQEQCVTWFDTMYPDLRLLLHHSPNEGKRSIIEGSHLKASGMRAGFPDLVLLMPSGEWSWLAMEFKSKGGRLSEAQKTYAEYLPQHNVLHKVIRTVDEFTSLVSEYIKNHKKQVNETKP